MPHGNRDGFGNVIRHFNQKIHNEHFAGHRTGAERERRHQTDELSLVDENVARHWLETNQTYEEVECSLRVEKRLADGVYCNKTWDKVLCWPATPAGATAFLPCFEEFNGIRYDPSDNASKECFENGTWDTYTDYTSCRAIHSGSELEGTDSNLTLIIYFIGYSVSLVALLVAMSIFLYFKDLRCLRNTIHTNLMFTYVMADATWILTGILQNSLEVDMTACVILTLVLHYFLITTFFWMFVEGLYLYMLVVETFNRKNIKAHVYVSVGWGIPIILVSVWGIAKAAAPVQVDASASDISVPLPNCHWMNVSVYDWIFKVPILTVMALNSVFLVMIMWVLITKLRSANNAETQQYRKATKALMVLIPLLGITYILTIVSSTDGVVAQIFYNLRALMLSSQGFLVALFYCFLNSEVQNTVRHHMDSWRTARALGGDRRYNYSKDWSPRSRTESIRLYSQPTITPYKKRESCASEATTTTVVNSYNNNGLRVSNGSAAAAAGAAASSSSGTFNAKVTTPFLAVTAENDV